MRAAASPSRAAAQSSTGTDRVARMRRHREEMELAVREGLSLVEARRRLHAQRLAEIEAARVRRHGAPAGRPDAEPAERPIPWYQRDDL